MTQQQPQMIVQPPTPEEIERLSALDKLEEVDFLKLRLLNRNIDMFDMQIELSKSKLKEAFQILEMFGSLLVQRYGVETLDQIDPNTGVINRKDGTPDAE